MVKLLDAAEFVDEYGRHPARIPFNQCLIPSLIHRQTNERRRRQSQTERAAADAPRIDILVIVAQRQYLVVICIQN